MRHDLSVYDLEPLREQVDRARARADALQTQVADRRVAVDDLEAQWWSAWAAFVKGGGDARVFYLSSASRQNYAPPEPPPEPKSPETKDAATATPRRGRHRWLRRLAPRPGHRGRWW